MILEETETMGANGRPAAWRSDAGRDFSIQTDPTEVRPAVAGSERPWWSLTGLAESGWAVILFRS